MFRKNSFEILDFRFQKMDKVAHRTHGISREATLLIISHSVNYIKNLILPILHNCNYTIDVVSQGAIDNRHE